MQRKNIIIAIIFIIGFSTLSYPYSGTKYLPEEVGVYCELNLHNFNKLFKELTLKFYSKEHYEQIAEYLRQVGETELNIDVTNPIAIQKQGIDLTKKVFLAVLPPYDVDLDLVIGAQLLDRKSFEKSVVIIFNKLYPKPSIKKELKKAKKNHNLKSILKKDLKKMIFKKRIMAVQYKGQVIKLFRRKTNSNYSGYESLKEIFSYAIIDNTVIFGKEKSIKKIINAYLYKENLIKNQDLHYIFKKLDEDSQVKIYISFENFLKHLALKPLAKNTIVMLTKGLGMSLSLSRDRIQAKSLLYLNKKHPGYKAFYQSFYPKKKRSDMVFYALPKGNFSYFHRNLNVHRLKTIIPYYQYIYPIVKNGRFFSFYSMLSHSAYWSYLENMGSELGFALYFPKKIPSEIADYHPHKLSFILFSEIKKKAGAYNLIDTVLKKYLRDKNSQLKEIKLNDHYFYFFSNKYIRFYIGVYKNLFIVASHQEKISQFMANMNKSEADKNSQSPNLNKPYLTDPFFNKENSQNYFLNLFVDFKALPLNIDVVDDDYRLLKKIDYIHLTGKIHEQLFNSELYIKLKE